MSVRNCNSIRFVSVLSNSRCPGYFGASLFWLDEFRLELVRESLVPAQKWVDIIKFDTTAIFFFYLQTCLLKLLKLYSDRIEKQNWKF